MDSSFLKTRTWIVLAVLIVFAAAAWPLTPRNFYEVFRAHCRPEAHLDAAYLEHKAKERQEAGGEYPASALLRVADDENIVLSRITTFSGAADNSAVVAQLRKKAAGAIRLGLDLHGGVEFILHLKPDYDTLLSSGMSRAEAAAKVREHYGAYRDLAMEALRKRLEARNIFETEITPFAAEGLSLRAPLVAPDEKDKLRELIVMSSKLEFRLVHPRSAELLRGDSPFVPVGYEVLQEKSARRDAARAPRWLVSRRVELAGTAVDRAFVSRNQYGAIAIALHFNREGAKRFAEITARNLHRQLAIVLDGKLYCAPVIQTAIQGGQAEITGHFSLEEAENIADALNSGSFPFAIEVDAVYDTAPTLGADNVRNGVRSGIIALVLLGIFMVGYYGKAGWVAVAALAADVVLILGAMAAFGATLTMPGIAGIILTLGMAVDANVLVFERMREERLAGAGASEQVRLGFQRACSAVLDGNLTTLVVALILIWLGSGAVKGFAVSLAIGIGASLFTALFMSRVIFDWMLKLRPGITFPMRQLFVRPAIPFMKQSRYALLGSALAVLVTVAWCGVKGRSLLSVDFTGGTLLSYRYSGTVPVAALEQCLTQHGLPAKITCKTSSVAADERKLELLFREGVAPDRAGGKSTPEMVRGLIRQNFPDLRLGDGETTVIGGMVGAQMTKSTLIALGLALFGMIIYVAFRYEFIYGLAGILALIHDAAVSLGIYLLSGRELSLPVAAGVLTVIGYSINDTIVIFDRIREERALHPGMPLATVVDLSLNRTLSRTILTSFTTFLVVAVMYHCGGAAINDFMLIIGLGIIVGSYSSLYLAAPMVVRYRSWRDKHTR